MELKKCPKCNRYSVSFDYQRGFEICHWIDCGWVNTKRTALPIAHRTIITRR